MFLWESIPILLPWNNFLFKFYSLFLFVLYGFFFLYFKGSFLALLIFLSIAGNILVCIAIYTERSLRRIGNLFLASLAIADLFVASLVMTFAGVNDILGKKFFFVYKIFIFHFLILMILKFIKDYSKMHFWYLKNYIFMKVENYKIF